MRIFTNNGSLKNCFDEFFKKCASFDAVICSNDFAAVSLIRNLLKIAPDELNRLKILSLCANKAFGLLQKYADLGKYEFRAIRKSGGIYLRKA